MDTPSPDAILALASSHGLALDAATLRVEEAGLDFRVAFARDAGGKDWVLRIPRRPDVTGRAEAEARTLAFLAPRLPVAVPRWQVCTPTLIAYERLPGAPGLTLDPQTKAPRFHVDPTSEAYGASLGAFIASLHRIDADEARAAGVPGSTADGLRAGWREQIAAVTGAFEVSTALHEHLAAWLGDDGLWPDETTLTHGELYGAHVLVDEQLEVRGVLDWTTAKVGDPAVDFMFQHMMAGPAFDVTVRAYEAAGGRRHPRLAERCTALAAAGPILYGVFALSTGQPEHREAAQAQLG